MSCNNLGDIDPCSMNKNTPTIKRAGEVVGIDLTNPIDCSQMDVYSISSMIDYPDRYDYNEVQVKRTSVLHAFVFNEYGEREELTITFELISQRFPKNDTSNHERGAGDDYPVIEPQNWK